VRAWQQRRAPLSKRALASREGGEQLALVIESGKQLGDLVRGAGVDCSSGRGRGSRRGRGDRAFLGEEAEGVTRGGGSYTRVPSSSSSSRCSDELILADLLLVASALTVGAGRQLVRAVVLAVRGQSTAVAAAAHGRPEVVACATSRPSGGIDLHRIGIAMSASSACSTPNS
jgi:hypothetical protein